MPDMTPFDLDTALEIAEDFEDLADTDLRLQSMTYIVDKVCPCPFAEEARERFVKNYVQTKDVEQAISFYAGEEYDVIVLAYSEADEQEYIFIDIRTFVEQRGINYNFP